MKNRLRLIWIRLWIGLLCTSTLIAQETLPPPKGIIAQIGKGQVGNVQYSADGRRIGISSRTGIWIYDATTLQLTSVIPNAPRMHNSAFPPGINVIARSDTFDYLHIWDPDTSSQALQDIEFVAGICFTYAPEMGKIAIGSGESTTRIWDAKTGKLERTLQRTDEKETFIHSIAFSPDGTLLAAGDGPDTISIWDTATGKHKHELKGHTHLVKNMAFSPDGSTLASISGDSNILLWNTHTWQQIDTLTGDMTGVEHIVYSQDGELLAAGCGDGRIHLWDANTGNQLRKMLTAHQGFRISAVVFVKDSRTLVSCSEYGTLRKWDVKTGKNTKAVANDYDTFSTFALSHDEKKLAALSEFSTPYLFDITVPASPKLIKRIHTRRVGNIAFSPDGKTIATEESDQIAYLWDMNIDIPEHLKGLFTEIDTTLWGMKIDRPKLSFKGHTAQLACIAFSPDGNTFATGGFDNTLRLWDTTTGKAKIIKEHNGWVESLAFSPDGKTIASGSLDATLRLWDVHTGAAKRVIRLSNTEPVEENQAIRELGKEIVDIAFSPDGKTIAAAASDPNIYLWDVETGERQPSPHTHTRTRGIVPAFSPGGIVTLAFSPDGCLVTGDADGIMKIYDVSEKKLLRMFDVGNSRVENLEFIREGKILVSVCEGVITLWDMTPP